MKWCKHIKWENHFWYGTGLYTKKHLGQYIPDHWTCCPICGTKRPKKTAMKEDHTNECQDEEIRNAGRAD
jgi:hypothetical protein